jgi:nesprin-1
VVEKANTMKDSPMFEQVSDTISSISKRYEELVDGYLKNITQLEESLAAFQVFYDLYKIHQDYQKQLWDQLAAYSGINLTL